MQISVVVPAYNSEKTIRKCLDSLCRQSTKENFEIIVVDDGSKDNTAEIVKKYPKVRYIFQKNNGPAAARNNGWKNAAGNIIIFTDSDCVPEANWLTEMVKPFNEAEDIGAVGGAYDKTINDGSKLAKIIGEEIKFRYRNIKNYTDAHGSYSLAVKKKVLAEINGFNEDYPVATAEDWDLCYKITRSGYKIYFTRKAMVGHYHPENFWKYLKTQCRHGYYRMMLYKDHPVMMAGDKYSGNAKWIVTLNTLLLLSLFGSIFLTNFLWIIGVLIITEMFLMIDVLFYFKDIRLKFEVLFIELARGFVWTIGAIAAFPKFFLFGK